MPIVKRHQVFLWFKKDFEGIPLRTIIWSFKSISDEDLAKYYLLKPLRKGYFYR